MVLPQKLTAYATSHALSMSSGSSLSVSSVYALSEMVPMAEHSHGTSSHSWGTPATRPAVHAVVISPRGAAAMLTSRAASPRSHAVAAGSVTPKYQRVHAG